MNWEVIGAANLVRDRTGSVSSYDEGKGTDCCVARGKSACVR